MNAVSPQPTTSRRDWLYLGIFIVVLLLITGIPYFYAQRLAGDDKQFMGIIFNIPDHFQYFSWMREAQDKFLVPNQLTPETSTPLLFNLLWWTLGRVESLTGLSYATLYQITRLLAGALLAVSIFWFCGLVFTNRAKRWTAFLLAMLASGLGWFMIVVKFLTKAADAPFPFTIYTSEPNSFFTTMAFPHFSIATALITLVFGMVLLAQRTQKLKYAWYGAIICLILTLQHSYDFFTICGVIAMFALFLWIRDRKFPVFMLKVGIIIVIVAVWPALQAFYITQADEVWKGVLSQFDNAGAWTPAPFLLPILMGIAWLLALWSIRVKMPWKDRDDTHLFLLAWFVSHFILIYLPLNFQIHLLSGWQVVIGVLATIGLYTRVLPILQRWFKNTPPSRLALGATVVLLLAVIPTNLYLVGQRFVDIKRAATEAEVPDNPAMAGASDNRLFISKGEYNALKYIETQVTGEDVVFANLGLGQFVPAITGARSFVGHWAQTLNFHDKFAAVQAFYNEATTDVDRQALLDTYSVDYVLYSPEEAKLGAFDPTTASYLEPVYDEGSVKVFKVASSG
ncbi:MAG: hypothetical protein LCI00_14945 [Chloroflexi bacterium]|nr:hypothetical protein [Chloroflexota bacterium]MCC6892594.1 hypothetical protein [Anaerolineae bacterium]